MRAPNINIKPHFNRRLSPSPPLMKYLFYKSTPRHKLSFYIYIFPRSFVLLTVFFKHADNKVKHKLDKNPINFSLEINHDDAYICPSLHYFSLCVSDSSFKTLNYLSCKLKYLVYIKIMSWIAYQWSSHSWSSSESK